MGQFSKVLQLLIMHTQHTTVDQAQVGKTRFMGPTVPLPLIRISVAVYKHSYLQLDHQILLQITSQHKNTQNLNRSNLLGSKIIQMVEKLQISRLKLTLKQCPIHFVAQDTCENTDITSQPGHKMIFLILVQFLLRKLGILVFQ